MKKCRPVKKENIHQGCLCCPPVLQTAKMNARIYVGFGSAEVTRNKKIIYSETPNTEWNDAPTLMKFENMARKDNKADWRMILNAPLSDRTYQRQGKNKWVLIKSGIGFA